MKHTTGALLRPIHAIAKIVTTPLKMVADIYKVCTKRISIKEFGKRTFEHLTDFIRVPFYSTLILITNILACTLSPLLCVFSKKAATSLCMKAREIAGNLELSMYRVDTVCDNKLKRELVPFLYACFTPLVDLEDKSYEEIQSALKRFAKRNIKFRRENKPLLQRPIYDILTCSSIPAAGEYISPVLA